MFAKSKVSQSMIDAVNKVLGEEPVEQKDQLLSETAPLKEPTPTGMRVYGGSYGNSAKAKKDQTKSPVDNLKGPKDKEMKEELKSETFEFHLTEGSYADLHKKWGDTHNIEYHSHTLYPKHTVTKFDNEKDAESHAKKNAGTVRMSVSPKMKNEELKGNQDKIDANHNDKIDAQDFKILKAKKKVKEGREFTDKLLETVRKSDVPAYLRKAKGDTPLTVADAKGPKKDSISAPENLAKARNEEVEHLDEGVMDKMSLSALWHKHGHHHYVFDQGHGHGYGSSHHNDKAMTAIENHVRKHHGNKVADDMVHHSELRTAADEYLGGKDARNAESTATKLRAKHKIQGDMHGNLDEEVEQIDEISKSTLGSYVKKAAKSNVKLGGEKTGLDMAGHEMGHERYKDEIDKNKEKIKTRDKGIYRAVKRLSTEEVELDEGISDFDRQEKSRLVKARIASATLASKPHDDKLLARTGMNIAHKFPRPGQTNLGNIPGMNTPGVSKDTADYAEKRRGDRAKQLKPAIKAALGTHGPKGNLPEEVELDEQINEVLSKDASAGDWIHDFVHSDNPKFAGKSTAERKKMALGAYYGAQKEAYEASNAPITTDTLTGRMPGGKSNSFKSFKTRVKPLAKEAGETETPDTNSAEKTSARSSIKAEEVQVEATIAGTPGWKVMKKDVTDKSGAVHSPMSRAKDLARQAFKTVSDKTKVKEQK